MKAATYYPYQHRIVFYDANGLPICGISGPLSHAKAIRTAAAGKTIMLVDNSKNEVLTNKK